MHSHGFKTIPSRCGFQHFVARSSQELRCQQEELRVVVSNQHCCGLAHARPRRVVHTFPHYAYMDRTATKGMHGALPRQYVFGCRWRLRTVGKGWLVETLSATEVAQVAI